jgi:hypothetical protein
MWQFYFFSQGGSESYWGKAGATAGDGDTGCGGAGPKTGRQRGYAGSYGARVPKFGPRGQRASSVCVFLCAFVWTYVGEVTYIMEQVQPRRSHRSMHVQMYICMYTRKRVGPKEMTTRRAVIFIYVCMYIHTYNRNRGMTTRAAMMISQRHASCLASHHRASAQQR